jgi:hypothetical protein
MKKSCLLLVAAIASSVGAAAEITVPSTYDEATGKWIGNVDELTNALHTAAAGCVVYLEKGEYDISFLSDNAAPMRVSATDGGSLLSMNKANLRLVGLTGKPDDVVITAKNSNHRILTMSASGTELHGVTISGGRALASNASTYKCRTGGGVYITDASVIISNCVFTGNSAALRGGAVAAIDNRKGIVYDSVFYGNCEAEESLCACFTTLHRCVFTNNVSQGFAKEAYGGSIVQSCHVYDSYFADNQSNGCGGIRGGVAVRCRFLRNRGYNPLGNNWNHGGCGGARDAVLSNCYFYGNTAYRRGGAVRGGSVVGCTVASNRTEQASNGEGGGIYGATLVENCVVVSNISVNGGGVFGTTTVRDSAIAYNKASSGGGAYSSALDNCAVEHNVATEYESANYGGAGGGLYGGSATNTVFRDNSCSATYNSSLLKGCEIADTSVNAKVIDSCVIHSLQNKDIARAIGNVAYPNGYVTSNLYMITLGKVMRNSLISNCVWKSLGGSFVNPAFFQPASAGTTGRVENCTFVDNQYHWLARNYKDSSKALAVVNSVFTGDISNSRGDVTGLDSWYIVLSNCVYRSKDGPSKKDSAFEDFGCMKITSMRDLKFLGEGAYFYTPKLTSPLRGWGLMLDWMTEDATDIAGNPRVREGKVDIGAYQCWLKPKYTSILVR